MNYKAKKIIELPEIKFSRTVAGRYKAMVVNSDGTISQETDWNRNKILDSGLDKIAYMPWAQVFQFCVAGNEPSNTVTAAAESDTGLNKPYMMNSFYLEGKANCGSKVYTVDDGAEKKTYLKLYRTFDFLTQRENVVITELGFKESPGSKKLFSRVVLDGQNGRPDPETVLAGQFLRVKYEINVRLDPVTINGESIESGTGTVDWDGAQTGTHGLQLIGMAGIDERGIAYPIDEGGFCNEPFAYGSVDFGPTWGFINRWENGPAIEPEIKTKNVTSSADVSISSSNTDYKSVSVSSLEDYFYINDIINFSNGASLKLVEEAYRGATTLVGILSEADITNGDSGTCQENIGYKQPDYDSGQRLTDMPGPFMGLYDYQNFNRFINEICIRNGETLGSNELNGTNISVGYSENLFSTPDEDTNITGANLAFSESSVTAEQVSGYWPWGNYLSASLFYKFADSYGLSITRKSDAQNAGTNILMNGIDRYFEQFQTPGFTIGPVTLVMNPVSRYRPAETATVYYGNSWTNNAPSDANFDSSQSPEFSKMYWPEGTKSVNDYKVMESYWFLSRHLYDPGFYSSEGSYLSSQENVLTKSFGGASNKSAFWESWHVRGSSCFLSNNSENVAQWGVNGNRGVAFNRAVKNNSDSSLADFYELPLRLNSYDSSIRQTAHTRERTKFCFFDNSVANSQIKSLNGNTQNIHDPWTIIGIGATTDWSINPPSMSGAAIDNGYVYKLDTPQHKDDEHILKVSFKYTWSREP